MDFQDVAHASGLHNSTSTTDTASNQQSFEKKVNNSTHEDVQNAASPSQSIPLKNLENTTKTETQPQTTSKTTHSGNENANAQIIAASSQVEKTTTHTSATSAITSEGVLEDTTTTATPNMDNANSASVKSRDVITPQPKDSNTIPTPNVVFEKSTDPNQFTFEITDLKEFNAAYQTKYYYRLSKPYDDSNDLTIELVNGETNSVVETKQINSPGTVSIGENSLERAVAARDPQKAKYGYINFTFLKDNKINKLGITDDYDETSVVVQSIEVYDGITGQDVTNLFDIIDENGVITATPKESLVKDHVLDNAQIPFRRYYKLDIVGVIKDSAKANKDITNVAIQSVQFFNPAKGGNEVPPPKPSEKRVNKVKPVNFEFKVPKKLEDGQLKGGDYTFILTDLNNPDHPVQSATNDANGKVNFLPIKFNKVGTYVYQISEQVRTDSNIAYDTMSIKATVVVTENPKTGNLQAAVTYNSSGGKSDGVNDTEFNNTVEPPVPPTPNKPPHNPPKTPSQPPVNPPGNPPEKPGVPPIHHVPPTPKQPNQPKHLPNTGSDDANMNKSLLATMFAGLGSVLLIGRRRLRNK